MSSPKVVGFIDIDLSTATHVPHLTHLILRIGPTLRLATVLKVNSGPAKNLASILLSYGYRYLSRWYLASHARTQKPVANLRADKDFADLIRPEYSRSGIQK
jgi:hypothetical protein